MRPSKHIVSSDFPISTWRSFHPTYPEGFCNLLKSASKCFHAPNDVFDIVDARKPNEEEVEKVGLIGWKRLAAEDLEEVAEIIPAENGSEFFG